MKKLIIYDNGGRTADRYSVYILDSYCGYHWYTMSPNACQPNGVNMYGGIVYAFTPDQNEQRIALKALPKEVKKAIQLRRKGA